MIFKLKNYGLTLKHNARHRSWDHGHVPVLHPCASVGRDRPVHRHTGGKEMQGEASEPHPQTNRQQGDIVSHRGILRDIHRCSGLVLSVVRDTVLLHNHNIMLHTHRRQVGHREPCQGQEPGGSCSGNRHGYSGEASQKRQPRQSETGTRDIGKIK